MTDLVPARSNIRILDFHGVHIPVLVGDRGRWVSVTALSNAMGIDAEAQRENIERKHWSQGHTGKTPVCLPGHTRSYNHFFIHEKRVPMWLANIDTARLKDATVRRRVEDTQVEFADVLAEWVTTGEVKPVDEPAQFEIPASFADAGCRRSWMTTPPSCGGRVCGGCRWCRCPPAGRALRPFG